MNKPEYTFGDLVKIIGYGARVFKIESYRIEQCYAPDEEWTDIVYDLIEVETGQYVECDEEDLRLADGEDEGADLDGTGIDIFEFMSGLFYDGEALSMAKDNPKEPRKLTQRELSSQEAAKRKQARKDRAEEIDNLLDIANWNREMLAKTGDESYGDALFGVEAKLFELTAEEA